MGRDRKEGIAGEDGGDRRGRHGAHHQPRAGAGIAEIQCRYGTFPVPHPGPLNMPAAGPFLGQGGAEAAQGAGGGMDIAGFQQSGDAGFAFRQRPQDKSPLRNGFVAGHLGRSLEGAGAAGGQRGGIGVMHQGLQKTFTAGAARGKRALQ